MRILILNQALTRMIKLIQWEPGQYTSTWNQQLSGTVTHAAFGRYT